MVKPSFRKSLVPSAFGVLLAMACASILGIEDRDPYPPADASVDPSVDPSVGDPKLEPPEDAGSEATTSDADASEAAADAADSGGLFEQPVLVVSGQDAPWGIAVDSQRIYWTNNVNKGALRTIDKNADGGNPIPIVAEVVNPTDIEVDDHIYLLRYGACWLWGIDRIDKLTFVSESLTGGCELLPRRMAVDDQFVYESRFGNNVKGRQKDGGGLAGWVVTDVAGVDCVTAAAGYFYYATYKTIYRRPAGFGPQSDGGSDADAGDEVFAISSADVLDMRSDTNAVYWLSFDKKVYSRAHTGTQNVELASDQDAKRIAVDDTYVVWTTGDFFVRAIKKDGPSDSANAVIEIATVQATPWGVAADSEGVYWTNRGDGTIRKALRTK